MNTALLDQVEAWYAAKPGHLYWHQHCIGQVVARLQNRLNWEGMNSLWLAEQLGVDPVIGTQLFWLNDIGCVNIGKFNAMPDFAQRITISRMIASLRESDGKHLQINI